MIDRANSSIQFPLYFIVLSITKIAVSLEPYVQTCCGLQHNIALILQHTMEMKTEFIFFEFRLVMFKEKDEHDFNI